MQDQNPSPDTLESLGQLFADKGLRSAHYSGSAHESILRVLSQHLGTAFSVTDFPDRYGTGAAFFWEGDQPAPVPAIPDWLEGVAFYHEGMPRTDLLVVDVRWFDNQRLLNMLSRRRIRHVFVNGPMPAEACHPAYVWSVMRDHGKGVLKR